MLSRVMAEESQAYPRIVVAFQNYSPPFDAEKTIRGMLRIVPPEYLWGLHSIVLTNVQALSRKERDRKTWGRRRVTLGEALGYYTPEWRGEPAHITILVDNLEKHWGRKWLRVGLVRDAELSRVLFHELGHHIHQVLKPKYEEKEDVADKWSKKLRGRFLRRRYWYLMPVFLPLGHLRRLGKKIARRFRRSVSAS
jgi:hypothetical protein